MGISDDFFHSCIHYSFGCVLFVISDVFHVYFHGNFGCVLFVSACLPILLTLTLASLFDAAMGISDDFFHSAAFILVVFSFFIWLCCVLFRPVFCQYSTLTQSLLLLKKAFRLTLTVSPTPLPGRVRQSCTLVDPTWFR